MEFIPLPTAEQTLLTITPTLDGELFFITFDFNSAIDSWTMKIQDVGGEPVVEGVRLVGDFPLLRNVNTDNRPVGEMFVLIPGEAEITGDTIEDCRLVYLEESELV